MTERPQGLWLWVARPEYTQADSTHGPGRAVVEPGYVGGRWRCAQDPRDGDLALLYRPAPNSEVRWLLKARGPRYSIADDPVAQSEGWEWGTDYEVLARFDRTITFAEMSTSQPLSRWDAVSRKLHGEKRVWPAPMAYWRALVARTGSRNTGATALFAEHMRPRPDWLRP
jgi:hypothetical protein